MTRVYVKGGWVEDHPTIPLADGVEAVVAYAARLHAKWLDDDRAEYAADAKDDALEQDAAT